MPKKITNQQKGRNLEKEVAQKLQAKQVPNSGAGPFRKLDVEGHEFLVSCKWADSVTLTLSGPTLREAEAACNGPGGTGSVPMWANRVRGADEGSERVYITVDIDDFISFFKERSISFQETKNEQKYSRANRPSLFR